MTSTREACPGKCCAANKSKPLCGGPPEAEPLSKVSALDRQKIVHDIAARLYRLKITCLGTSRGLLERAIKQLRRGNTMPIWDKAALFHDTQAFIEHLQRLE